MLQLHPAHPYSSCDGWLTIKLDRDARKEKCSRNLLMQHRVSSVRGGNYIARGPCV